MTRTLAQHISQEKSANAGFYVMVVVAGERLNNGLTYAQCNTECILSASVLKAPYARFACRMPKATRYYTARQTEDTVDVAQDDVIPRNTVASPRRKRRLFHCPPPHLQCVNTQQLLERLHIMPRLRRQRNDGA